MGNYEAGIITKNKILDAYKQLFYQKGYKNTTYKDIYDITGINQGLITYYFKSKRVIAGAVHSELWEHIKAKVKEYLIKTYNHYELQIGTTLEQIIFINLKCEDENFKRFIYEISTEGIILEYDITDLRHFYDLHVKEYNLNLTDKQIRMIQTANSSLTVGMSIKLIDGYLGVTLKEYIEFRTRIMYELMGISDQRITEILDECHRIYDQLNVTLKDYFQIEIQ